LVQRVDGAERVIRGSTWGLEGMKKKMNLSWGRYVSEPSTQHEVRWEPGKGFSPKTGVKKIVQYTFWTGGGGKELVYKS